MRFYDCFLLFFFFLFFFSFRDCVLSFFLVLIQYAKPESGIGFPGAFELIKQVVY